MTEKTQESMGGVGREMGPLMPVLARAFKLAVAHVERESGVPGMWWFVMGVDASPIPRRAEALHRDAAGDPEDDRLAALLAPTEGTENGTRPEALLGLAERIESGEGGYLNQVSAAASLTGGQDGDDERERAVRASKSIIRPLAAPGPD